MLHLKELFDMNQRLLGLLGVSHPTLDQIISTANKYGLQGKLTGAGGGGCAFVFITPGKRNIFQIHLVRERLVNNI